MQSNGGRENTSPKPGRSPGTSEKTPSGFDVEAPKDLEKQVGDGPTSADLTQPEKQPVPNSSESPLLSEVPLSPDAPNIAETDFDPQSSQTTVKTIKLKGWKRLIGIGCMTASSFFLALCLVYVHLAHKVDKFNVFTISLWRFQGLLYPSLIWAAVEIFYCHQNPWKAIYPCNTIERRRIIAAVLGRSLFGVTGVICLYHAAVFLSPADAMTISMTSPALVAIVSRFIFKESYGFVTVFATILNIAGLVLIAAPWQAHTRTSNALIGLTFALVSLCTVAGVVLLLRYLRKVSYSVIAVTFGIFGSVISLCCMALAGKITQHPTTPTQWFHAFIIGASTFTGQAFLIFSLKFEEAGVVSMVQMCQILFSYMWEYIIIGTLPTALELVGTSIILLGIFIIGGRKIVEKLPDDDVNKRRFRFLMW